MTPELSKQTVVVASGEQVSETVDDEEIVLDLDSGEYYGVSGVGVRIWELLQTPTTGEEIRTEICKEYDVEPERCGEDVMAFLETLAGKNLIDVTDESTSE